jgi:hypothetical protein
VCPRKLAQVAGAEAERERQHEQRFEPAAHAGFNVQAEFGAAEAAGGYGQVGVDLGDGGLAARPRAAGQFAGLRGRVGGCIAGRTHLHHLGVARRLAARGPKHLARLLLAHGP